MDLVIAQRERALFDVLVDDLAHWVSETAPASAAADSRSRSSSLATDASACNATAAAAGDRNRDFFDTIRDGRVLCALLGAISSQHSTPMRGRSGSSAAASDFQARSVPCSAQDIVTLTVLLLRFIRLLLKILCRSSHLSSTFAVLNAATI